MFPHTPKRHHRHTEVRFQFPSRAGSWSRFRHHVARSHSCRVVKADVTVEEPGARIVRSHVPYHHLHCRHAHHISSHVVRHHCVPVPVGSVKVEIVGRAHQIPPH